MLTVVFDLDGTLADTSGDLLAAANACFRAMGHGDVLTQADDAAVALRGGKAMLRAGLTRVTGQADEAVIDDYYPMLLKAYEEDIDRHTQLYPGAMAAVHSLRDAGHPVAICTNKPEHLARLLLERLGVLKDFDALIGADTLPVRKPDPAPLFEAVKQAGGDPQNAVLVGDTKTDRDTARAAKVGCILVNFGPGGDVASLEPDALLYHFEELPEVLVTLANAPRT